MAQPITSALAITSEQGKWLVRLVVDAAESAVELTVAQADFLDKNGAQLVIERSDELKVAIYQAIINVLKQLSSRYPVLAETRFLKPVGKSTVPARTKPFNAAGFYQTGASLFVSDTFADRFELSNREIVDSAPERPYVALLLKENAYDRDIRKELPDTHLATLEDIAGLIETQLGFLLNNGYANIFYVEGKSGEVFAVVVSWHSDGRRWSVYDWQLDSLSYWNDGIYVLCPGNAAL